ncbi:MAG: sigma-70 family RNA polymerase sigma factor [Anaerolineaceae bacterium]|nr:sigma-70 family RNA polymerase sigma factor [Anaerolineaceae bacterium]
MNALSKLFSLHKVKEADPDWELVYETKLPLIFNYFLYHTADPSTAEDLSSICFERAWKARKRYIPERASMSTWLFGIARNVLHEHLRSPQRRCETAMNEAAEQQAGPHNPELEAQAAEDLARLRAAVLSLPERERELVSLKYGAGLRNKEIAPVMGLTESNVGTLLQRVLQKLSILKEDHHE